MSDPGTIWVLLACYVTDYRDRCNTRLVCRAAATALTRPRHSQYFYNLDDPDNLAEQCRGSRSWALDAPKGKKRFVVATALALQRLLLSLPPLDRNFYEIVSTPVCRSGTLGATAACRPYADVEFERSGMTTTKTDLEVTQHVVRGFIEHVRARSSIHVARVKVFVMVSSNDKKYSIHIVLHIHDRDGNEIRFRNCMHIGAIVRHWEVLCRDRTDCADMYWTNKHGELEFLVDKGVYTIRRQIRLVHNTKKDHGRWLVPIDWHTGETVDIDHNSWHDYVIQDHRPGTSEAWDGSAAVLAEATETDGSPPRATSTFWGAKVERAEPADLRLARWQHTQHAKRYGYNKRAAEPTTLAEHTARLAKRQRTPHASSLPDDGRKTLEQACVTWVARHTSNPAAYTVRRDPQTCTIATVGSHECRIRGAPHASNHIYFVANLCYESISQKCHDGHCEGKRDIQELSPELEKHMRIATQFEAAIKLFFM